jgi:hypothetical protein
LSNYFEIESLMKELDGDGGCNITYEELKIDRLNSTVFWVPKEGTNPILPQVFPNRSFWFHFP